jgi:excisionase family DNA binding protein
VVEIELNGARVPIDLDDRALRAIALALPHTPEREPWPHWMSTETAAAYLDCSVERVRKLVARRQIPFAQEGHGCRLEFSRDDLDEWMRSRRVAARGEQFVIEG